MQTITIKKTSDEAKKERTYPYMGMFKDNNIMVWFVSEKKGIAIKHPDPQERLDIIGYWAEGFFTPMQGDYTFTFNND